MDVTVTARIDHLLGTFFLKGIARKQRTFGNGRTCQLRDVRMIPLTYYSSGQFMDVTVAARIDHLLGAASFPCETCQSITLRCRNNSSWLRQVCITPRIP